MRSSPEVQSAAEGSARPIAEELPPGALLNMELSQLAFNRRVLMLAEDPATPLLERARFLSIFSANLDEFFRVRVAGFKRQTAAGSTKATLDGVSPTEQLQAIGSRARRLVAHSYRLLFHDLLPQLEAHGIRVLRLAELDPQDRAYLHEYYIDQVHALLTPLAIGPGHPFPHIRNLRPSLIVLARGAREGAEHSGILELPGSLPRFVPLPDGHRFVPLEAVIRANLPELYPGMNVTGAYAFRVTRSAVLQLEKQEPVTDVLQAVEREIRRRPYRPVVRLEVDRGMPQPMQQLLLGELQKEAREQNSALGEEDIYPVEWLIDLRGFREIASLPIPELQYPAPEPGTPIDPNRSICDLLGNQEVLVHFPEDAFEATVERFLLEAADDPNVLSIKLALYRTNRSSRIVEALRRASANGKQVVALLELTARFDEQKNVDWAHYLQGSGIHVVYGRPGLKIHSKIALVLRQEGEDVRRYLYIGTGNLNAATASAYTDLGLLSADPELGEDLNDVFNVITGDSNHTSYRQLLVAPYNMRRRFLEMIDRETAHARDGRKGHIRAKFNGLADREMITALYRASQAGVRIDLIVRGICALRPGVVGLSENIRVFSILGRFLEHSRIFYFGNDGDPEYYIGSGDWRTRNLSKRVEVAVPVRNPQHRARLDRILRSDLENPRAWELGADGSYYQRPEPAPRGAQLSS